MSHRPYRGLVAAPHTPFDRRGALDLSPVEHQATTLRREGVTAVFVGGSTGEFAALTHDERFALAQRWLEVTRGSDLRVVVHVGGCAVEAGRDLARRVAALGTETIAALAPFYYRPSTVEALLACCELWAAAAPEAGFYYYDIPALTGIDLPLPEFAERARAELPTFAGIKHTSSDQVVMQQCLALDGTDVLHGNDETLLAGLALGARGAVGSTYNLCPGVYLRLQAAFAAGDLATARREQRRAIQLVHTLGRRGYLAAAKAVMAELGVDVGPPRLPHRPLDATARAALRAELETMGFFGWRTADELSARGGADW